MDKNKQITVPLVRNNKYKQDLWYLVCVFVQYPELLTKKDIRKLKFRGVISRAPMNPFAIRDLLCKKKQTVKIGTLPCAWCKCKTVVLHAHHFPVHKCMGGKKTVGICPNCHAEYHYLMDTHYELKKQAKDYYNNAMKNLGGQV